MRFVVISGPASSGKYPLARKLMAEDRSLLLVHRDDLRRDFVNHVDEWHITLAMAALVRVLLSLGLSPIVVAWNLEPEDRALWTGLATEYSVDLEWLDVREPSVSAMIPPSVRERAQDIAAIIR